MTSVIEILTRLGGSASAAELLRETSRRVLNDAVRQGEVERLARGIYALPSLGPEMLAALAYDGVVSHLSAAVVWRLPLLARPDKPHITVPVKRRPRSGRPVVLHWAAVSADEKRDRVTSLVRTVVDCARILPFGEALAVADAVLATGQVSHAELETAMAAMRGRGRPMAVRVGAVATGRSESFLESMLRSLLLTAGIEGFEPQVVVRGSGFLARVDLGHRQARIAVEAEGYEFHGAPAAFAADCRRYDDLVVAGWLVLRFTFQHVIGDPEWVIGAVRRAVSLRTGGCADGAAA